MGHEAVGKAMEQREPSMMSMARGDLSEQFKLLPCQKPNLSRVILQICYRKLGDMASVVLLLVFQGSSGTRNTNEDLIPNSFQMI